MQAQELNQEAKILLDLVARKTTSLADHVMELDVSEYANPGQFKRECQELFRNHAQFVGASSLLPNPGDYYAFDDTGIPIIVTRKADGSLGAYLNACSHRGAPLGDGLGQANKKRLLSCPYHGWAYDLDGKLIGVPFGDEGFTGMDRETRGLRPLDVQEKHGMIFVMPNPELSFDIDEVLAGIGSQFSGFGFDNHHFLGVKRVETAISWKLNMDTFHEFYHFDTLHPETIALTAYNNVCHYQQFGRNHFMSSPSRQIHDLEQQSEDQWQPREHMSFVSYIFPNTVIFVVGDHFQTWRVYPVDQQHSVVYHSMYVPKAPQTEEEEAEYQAYFQMINDVAVTEDYALVEKMQRGVNAGIERTMMIGRNEPGVQNMHRQINDLLSPPTAVQL